ncbi:MAG: hypothetical protein DRO88_06235 [Promethearchaeia archaeon]|nr:MAG: hypothetical protein DRO88_06235 [Candidatus Lokiarchaeia archaeon]
MYLGSNLLPICRTKPQKRFFQLLPTPRLAPYLSQRCGIKMHVNNSISNLPKQHFVSRMQEGEFVFGGEIEYSTSLDLQTYRNQANFLKSHTSVLAIPDNPGSNIFLSNIAIAQVIQSLYPYDLVLSISCRDTNRLGLATRLITAYSLGFRNLLLVTGDHPSLGSVPSSKPVFDLDSTQLLHLCHEFNQSGTLFGNYFEKSQGIDYKLCQNADSDQDFCIIPPRLVVGTVINPQNSLPEIEMARFQRKKTEGIDFIQTQVIFQAEAVIPLLKEFHHEKIPIMAGIVPLNNYSLAKKISNFLPGVKFPKSLLQAYKIASQNSDNSKNKAKMFDKININYYSPLITELKHKNLIQGLYFATIDYPIIIPALIRSILNG